MQSLDLTASPETVPVPRSFGFLRAGGAEAAGAESSLQPSVLSHPAPNSPLLAVKGTPTPAQPPHSPSQALGASRAPDSFHILSLPAAPGTLVQGSAEKPEPHTDPGTPASFHTNMQRPLHFHFIFQFATKTKPRADLREERKELRPR